MSRWKDISKVCNEEALIGEEFGGVEGANLGEGLVELWS
jgi:hypothetical protein